MSNGQDQLAAAYAACEALTRRRARNFYYGLKLSPQPQRDALYAVYAWMRHADDIVDHPNAETEATRVDVAAFRAATDAAFGGHPPSDSLWWRAFADTAAQFRLAARPFHDMLDGQLDDLTIRAYDDFESLHEYCYRVASTVGLICVRIWGCDDPRADDLAIQRGVAFQLTNILRDFAEDFDDGRVYLPADGFAAHDMTPRILREWSQPERCAAFVEAEVARARSYYEQSAALDEMIAPACRPTLWAMTRIYRQLLEKIDRQPKAIVERRLRLHSLHKGAIALRARWRMKRAQARPPQAASVRAGAR